MNIIYTDGHKYKIESMWRPTKDSTKKDYNNNLYPYPEETKEWHNRKTFLGQLGMVEEYVRYAKRFTKKKKRKSCMLCNQKNVGTGVFIMNSIIWEDSLYHYVDVHNVKPSEDFIDYVFRFKYPLSTLKRNTVLKSAIIKRQKKKFLKLDKNQILIMDALFEHGGGKRKYADKSKKNVFRFSEHAGLLDFDNKGLEKIIISGKTNIVDKYDDDIYLPDNLDAFFDYEYMFHTHPATPRPGSRVPDGILYEFPSINDFIHYLDHYNMGKTQGSVIIAPEGMYIVRRYSNKPKPHKINEKNFYKEAMDTINEIQDDAIDKYERGLTIKKFHSVVAKDHSFVNRLNRFLHRYDFHVEYFHRVIDKNKKWIIDTLYLPINVQEPIITNKKSLR